VIREQLSHRRQFNCGFREPPEGCICRHGSTV
jgi:hypothetical protein